MTLTMKQEKANPTISVVLFLAAIALIPYDGYTIYKYWGWFILPAFPDLPELSTSKGIGLSMFAAVLMFKRSDIILGDSPRESQHRAFAYLVGVLLLLPFGWLVQALIS